MNESHEDINVMVSVLCVTYNHEDYIRDALDSFVMQKTTFPFQVIVHDDASSDNTPKIILEYAEKYPNIIIPVLETENQYCKGMSHFAKNLLPLAKGKYFATCEGDDYWIDENKLQLQYEALEKHNEIDLCACGTCVTEAYTNKIDKRASISPFKKDCIVSTAEVIRGGGGFVGTPSLLYRRAILDKWPEFFEFLPYDYSYQIFGSLRGGMYYLHQVMACARKPHKGSVSDDFNTNIEKIIIFDNEVIRMLQILNRETGRRYEEIIDSRISHHKYLNYYRERLKKIMSTHLGVKPTPTIHKYIYVASIIAQKFHKKI